MGSFNLFITFQNVCLIATGLCFLSFLKLLFQNVVSPYLFSKRNQIRKFGNWVVITGATDGIGRAFAELLAAEKYKLILISRSNEKLEKVKFDLISKYKIDVQIITADFTQTDIYSKIEEELKGKDIGLLINNVGMSSEYPDYLTDDHRNSNQLIINLINCNCLSTALMTKMFLKTKMTGKGGFVLNISSSITLFPGPFLTMYRASKSFVNSFTTSIASEFKNNNINFQVVVPFYVSTKMSKVKPSIFVKTPIQYANGVLNRLGCSKFTSGCFSHELLRWLIGFIPEFLMEKVIYSSMFNIRKSAIRKAAKLK